jgi:hypothetical protein
MGTFGVVPFYCDELREAAAAFLAFGCARQFGANNSEISETPRFWVVCAFTGSFAS